MAYKDLLVHIDDDAAHRVGAAIALAKRQDAMVTGVALALEATTSSFLGGVLPVSLSGNERELVRKAAEAAAGAFEAAAKAAGVRHETRTITCGATTATAELGFHARHADLIFMGQPDPGRSNAGFLAALLDGVMLGSGTPVYVVPYIGRAEMQHRKAVIAWDGSRKAARALKDAIPLLEGRGGEVVVLVVNPADQRGRLGAVPGAEVVTHLGRHGITARIDQQVADGLPVGTVILNYLADAGADLLVMGAYGHSRMRERMFGGVSDVVIQQMTAPVLLSG